MRRKIAGAFIVSSRICHMFFEWSKSFLPIVYDGEFGTLADHLTVPRSIPLRPHVYRRGRFFLNR